MLISKNWTQHYRPPSQTPWEGRVDGPDALRIHEVVTCLDLREEIKVSTKNAFGIIGFASDEGVRRNHGRVGAAEGPLAFRKTFSNMPVNRTLSIFDGGDIVCSEGDLKASQECLGESIEIFLNKGIRPLVIGGGHETAWGHFQGLQRHEIKTYSIINFDAHFDLRQGEESSGTPFLQVAKLCRSTDIGFDYTCIGIQKTSNTDALYNKAEELNVKHIGAELVEIEADLLLNSVIQKKRPIYLSICLDVFAAPYAPGVSAPQPLGLIPREVIPLLQKIAQSGQLKSVDIVELAPCYDRDDVTAKLAANLIWHVMSSWV